MNDVRAKVSDSVLSPQAGICNKSSTLIRRAVIFLTFAISSPGAISNLSADVSYTTTSSKGWSRIAVVNNLGLATTNTLTGTGISTTGLTPVWRADGSLESVALEIGGESHTASFKPDGTLASLTAPGRGNILGNHSISNGIESITIDGVTVERALDGTEMDIGGGEVIGRNEKLTATGNGFKLKTKPDLGGETDIDFSAALAPTGKNYAAGPGEAYVLNLKGTLGI